MSCSGRLHVGGEIKQPPQAPRRILSDRPGSFCPGGVPAVRDRQTACRARVVPMSRSLERRTPLMCVESPPSPPLPLSHTYVFLKKAGYRRQPLRCKGFFVPFDRDILRDIGTRPGHWDTTGTSRKPAWGRLASPILRRASAWLPGAIGVPRWRSWRVLRRLARHGATPPDRPPWLSGSWGSAWLRSGRLRYRPRTSGGCSC